MTDQFHGGRGSVFAGTDNSAFTDKLQDLARVRAWGAQHAAALHSIPAGESIAHVKEAIFALTAHEEFLVAGRLTFVLELLTKLEYYQQVLKENGGVTVEVDA